MGKDKKALPEKSKKTSIGGQALIEGIMMRGPKKSAMAVRDPDGEIVMEKWDTKSATKEGFFKLPIVRGVVAYVESMVSGYKCLMRSAEISGLEDAEEEMKREKEAKKRAKSDAKAGKASEQNEAASVDGTDAQSVPPAGSGKITNEDTDVTESVKTAEGSDIALTADNDKKAENGQKNDSEKKSSALTTSVMIFSVLLGLGLGILFFIVAPSYICKLLGKIIPAVDQNRWVRSIIEGILKIAIMVGYMAAVSLMKDIKRTFMYHGAEHKTIFCYENGLPLTVENVRIQRRFHPRCGTSFLILMLLVGIFISFFIPPAIPTALRVLIKILLLPITVGVGYELIKLAGRKNNLFTRIISAPGMWLQHLTTKEPDDSMIECAIAAMNEVIPDDGSDNW